MEPYRLTQWMIEGVPKPCISLPAPDLAGRRTITRGGTTMFLIQQSQNGFAVYHVPRQRSCHWWDVSRKRTIRVSSRFTRSAVDGIPLQNGERHCWEGLAEISA